MDRLNATVWLCVIVAAGAAIALTLWIMTPANVKPPEAPIPTPPTLPSNVDVTPPKVKFVDITAESGISFSHTNGSFGLKLLPETMGSGCAFFDFDNDGDQDLLLINSRFWPDDPKAASSPKPVLALYRNDGTGKFTDCTAEVGLDVSLFGMGVAVGDYDNDGYPDLFITSIDIDGNHLFHNEGGKSFRDVTAGDLSVHKGWGTGAAFFDANNDGKLDLFVANYVKWTREIDVAQGFQIAGVGRAFGPPFAFEGSSCQLFLGDGTGNFKDVSAEAGIEKTNANTGQPMGKSLSVVTCDLDYDGWMDILVANDTVQNFLFHNKGGGVFEEIGSEVGIAFDASGLARGAMGIDVVQYREGTSAIAIGNFANEMTAFYVNQKPNKMFFSDRAIPEGIGPPSQLLLKFGLCFFDYDLDGRPDLITANGHLEEEIQKVQASQNYAQPLQLFWNCGPDNRVIFVPVTAENVGPDLFKPLVGRGLAYADIDGDGDLDILITSNGGPPKLLRNDGGNKNHWLRVVLEGDGTHSNRSAVGAVVEAKVGDSTERLELMGGRSYLSQPESVLTFGLEQATQVDRLTVTWPGGMKQVLEKIPGNQVLKIRQEVKAESETTAAQ